MAHISHLVEDRDITLSDIVDIAHKAANGQLQATEKLDGANLMYTCTSKFEVRAARSEGDIKLGGLHASVLEAKFVGRGLVQDTFVKGFTALRTALLGLNLRQVADAFDNGKNWYSVEILYTGNPNLVRYDNDALILHEHPTLRCHNSVVTDGPTRTFSVLEKALPDLDRDAKSVGWRLHGPQRLNWEPMQNVASLARLDALAASMGPKELRLQDWLVTQAVRALAPQGMRPALLHEAALRLAEASGCPSLTVLKPRVTSATVSLLRASDAWVAKQLRPLELALIDFAVDLLDNIKPSLVSDEPAETARIRAKLDESLSRVKQSRNQHAIDYVATQMEKGPARVTAVEGIVFPWGEKLYKLTGAFAPANAIIGLCRYGRGKNIPAIG